MFEDLLQTLGLSAFSLKGFGPLLLQGTWMTVKLSVFSLAVSVLLGLLGATAKLSSLPFLRIPAQIYTTLIRGVPDLVLMLLIFYSLQIWLTSFTDFMEWDYIEIDPFRRRGDHPGLYLRCVFHRDLSRRDPRRAPWPIGGRHGLRAHAWPAVSLRDLPADDALRPAGH